MIKGYLDRIVDGNHAVILIEETKQEIILPVSQLPEGCKEKMWLNLKEENGMYTVTAVDEEKTTFESKRSEDLLAQLRARSKGSKFKKN